MRTTFYFPAPALVAVISAAIYTGLCSAETPGKILGASSCASSSCHGGGGALHNQFLVWSLRDFHSSRPSAMLATARASQIGGALNIGDVTADPRCTICHAPLLLAPQSLRGSLFQPGEGVSCESCHGPAEHWIRSHTRPDFTEADRVAAGMRDLENLYIRANVCVACHQNVSSDLINAGHPVLMFEMDGQCAAEPRHWTSEKNGNGAQAWLVGQAAALREMSWQWSNGGTPSDHESNRWTALVWLLKTAQPETDFKILADGNGADLGKKARSLQDQADELARHVAAQQWTPDATRRLLQRLAASSPDFRNSNTSTLQQADRAGRLVLALDRLVGSLPELKTRQPLQSALDQMFAEAQSIPDFNPVQFSTTLDQFRAALPWQNSP